MQNTNDPRQLLHQLLEYVLANARPQLDSSESESESECDESEPEPEPEPEYVKLGVLLSANS